MMLRTAILAVAVLLLVVTSCVALVEPSVWLPALVLALLVAAIAFENRRYRQNHGQTPVSLEPTNERFIDPETGRKMRVWANASGERSYIEE
jgi:hypothetical protein